MLQKLFDNEIKQRRSGIPSLIGLECNRLWYADQQPKVISNESTIHMSLKGTNILSVARNTINLHTGMSHQSFR